MAGSLPLSDGRYLLRSGPGERVVVIETEGALPPPRRRRRRPRKVVVTEAQVPVTITVVTVVLAEQPLAAEHDAAAWLERAGDADTTGGLLDDALNTLDRARAAEANASAAPFGTPTEVGSVLAARIGYGEGDQVASGRFLDALEVDARGGTGEKRRERSARTGSLARTAAILGGRESPTACETLIPRVRLDLNTGNHAAAFLGVARAVEATISELEFAVDDPGHEQDLDRLEQILPRLEEISARALDAPEGVAEVEEALGVAERVIRRRRILAQ